MSTYKSNLFSINGVIDTNRPVLENINDIATAVGAFVTYDVGEGRWSVILNTTGTSVASFNDSNIIGNLDISGTSVQELYNSASIEFPNRDLRGAIDYVDINIGSGLRFANELDNRLNIKMTMINDSAQAQYIAASELKQSRVDKIIQFRTDYSYLGLKAGELIDITSEMYGYTNKVFRIIKIEEDDSEGLYIRITALEYDASVYTTDFLKISNRTKRTRILPRQLNQSLDRADDLDTGNQLNRLLLANIAAGLLNPKAGGLISAIFKALTGKGGKVDENGNPTGEIVDENGDPVLDKATADAEKILGGAKAPTLSTIEGPNQVCEGTSTTIIVGHTCSSCLFDIPPIDYPYTITGISAGDIDIPLTGTVTVTNGVGTLTFIPTVDGESEGTETATITIGGLTKTVQIFDQKDYTYSVTKNLASITEGGTVVVTLTATGSKADATIPYAITGTASGKVSSPALTGTVTTSGGTATLTIVTTDDSIVQGTQGLTVTFEPALVDPCGTVGTRSTSITVLDNDTPPPPDTSCVYVSVPAVWCGQFDGTTGALKGITVRSSVNLPVPQAGEATVFVPYECSVVGGAIVVDEEIEVAAASVNCGGFPVRIITAFNAVPARGIITGTTITLYGY